MINKEVSVVIPAFNEADNLVELVAALKKLEDNYKEYIFEFILINDGSNDNTEEIFITESKKLSKSKLVSHYFNLGLTEALKNGVAAASFQYIFFLPADLQFSPDIIPGFLDKANEGFDIITGKKVGKYNKRFVSNIYNWMCKLIFGVKVTDINSVKIFDRRIVENMNLHKDWHRYIVPLASMEGKKITEIPVTLYPRNKGKSKFSGKLRILIGIFDLLTVRLLWSFKDKPMLIFGSLGIISLFIGIISGLYFSYSRLIRKLPYEPSTTFVALFLISGILFLMSGFLGELLIEKKK